MVESMHGVFDTKRDERDDVSSVIFRLSALLSLQLRVSGYIHVIIHHKADHRVEFRDSGTPSPAGKHGIINRAIAVSPVVPVLSIIPSLSRAIIALACSNYSSDSMNNRTCWCCSLEIPSRTSGYHQLQ